MVDSFFNLVLSNLRVTLAVCFGLFAVLVLILIISNKAKTYSMWYKAGKMLDKICNFCLVVTLIIFFLEILFVLYQVSQLLHSGGY